MRSGLGSRPSVRRPFLGERDGVGKMCLAGLSCLLLMSCTTTLLPQAESVRWTKNPEEVRACKLLGPVQAEPPFSTPDSPHIKLRNEAAALGGDTVLQTSGANILGKAWKGYAYKCGKRAT